MYEKQLMPNGGYKPIPNGSLNSQYKGGLVTNYVWMQKQCKNGLTIREIGKLANRASRTVARWLEKHNLKTKGIRKFKTGLDHHNYIGARICGECGGKKSHGSKYCMKCRKKNKTYPEYKDINQLKSYIRSSVVVEWRKEIFERDKYTCQKCGDSKGGNLRAHHIKRLSIIIDEIVNKSQEKDLKYLMEVVSKDKNVLSKENGITLCKECHNDLHKGKRKEIYKI